MNFHMLHPADRIVMIMRRLYDYGMTTTSGGNISIRDEDGTVWITPGGTDKGSLRREDIVRILPDGTVEGVHKPSSEYPFHMAIYACRPDVNAVLHAHPSSLCSFSILRRPPETSYVPDAGYICGKIAVAEYAVPGSELLGEMITREFSKGHSSVILENHGVVIGASELFEAFNIFETLIFCAKLSINAARISARPVGLSRDQITLYRLKTTVAPEEFKPESNSSEELEARRSMCRLINRAYDHGLFSSTQGTFSARLSDGSIIVTPYAMDRKYIEPEDLVRVESSEDTDGIKKEKGKFPSRSVVLHNEIYKANPDINSIIIARPPEIMAYVITDSEFTTKTVPESSAVLRDVKKYPFGTTFMQPKQLAREISSDAPVCAIENDCVIVCGSSQLQAYDRLEVLENSAKTLTDALSLGGRIVTFNDEETEAIKRAFGII